MQFFKRPRPWMSTPSGFVVQWREVGIQWKVWGPMPSPLGRRCELEMRYIMEQLGYAQVPWKFAYDNRGLLQADLVRLGDGLELEHILIPSSRSSSSSQVAEFRCTSGMLLLWLGKYAMKRRSTRAVKLRAEVVGSKLLEEILGGTNPGTAVLREALTKNGAKPFETMHAMLTNNDPGQLQALWFRKYE